MATSSFKKRFYVTKQKAKEFTEEMEKEANPTLSKEFKTQLKRGKEAREFLQKIALGE